MKADGGWTKGPWEASLGEFAFTNSGQRAVTTEAPDDRMPVHIAFVSPVADRKRNTPYNAPDPERDANARLIAAAPELYEALAYAEVEFVAAVMVNDPETYPTVEKANRHPTVLKIQAALAKARGESATGGME